ncbi:response regulator transcription factor [Paenibacillus thalictri]|uniref:response regulator transcription factor n=1 Tax=Paenibacillus thalictri TaxID=2527873 RepID=UPI0019816135|nr:response regulator [Paenibacillus thalictri]
MYKLILVEDDYQIRAGLSTYFPWADIGYEMLGSFENGKLALDYISANPVDIILSDIRMPVMNGLELADELEKLKLKVTVVFLSAYEDFKYAQQAINLGVKNYIVKSTKFDDLVTVFRKIKKELDERREESSEPVQAHADHYKVRKMKAYIEENYKDVTLQSTASEMNMNQNYVSRLFKEKTGVNFIDYVTEVKMKKAAAYILQTDIKLYQISEMVGYSNAKNFSRAFKNYFGVSPQQYKNYQ